MKLIYILCFLISVQSFASNRIDQHNNAVNVLSSFNLFKDGRGMVISPDLVKLYDLLKAKRLGVSPNGILNKRWGLNLDGKEIKGMYSIPYKNMKIGVLGCVACHGGKAAGQYIVGLGNKTIDVGQIGKDAYLVQMIWGKLPRKHKPEFKEIHNRAMSFTKGLASKELANSTQGLVPTSLVRSWFYRMAGEELPKDFRKGQVKVPHMWGYGEKRKSGSFWDGEANGVLPGWGPAVELYAGQTVENVRGYIDTVEQAEQYLGQLLPPKYPFKIKSAKAKNGKILFKAKCSRCHGSYERDNDGLPIFKSPKHIPWRVVKTDKDRLEALTPKMYELIAKNPLNDYMQSIPRKEKGYVAPRLWGIWSRFPYMHNASIPTMMDIFEEPTKRPIIFDMFRSGEKDRYDEVNLGLKINRDKNSKQYKKLMKKANRGKRYIYFTKRSGLSNEGHYFNSFRSLTQENKLEIIEYLKTL